MTSAVDTCDSQSELLVSNVDVGETARAGSWKSFSVSQSLAASSSESKSSGYCSKMSPGAPASSPSSSKSRPPPGRNQENMAQLKRLFCASPPSISHSMTPMASSSSPAIARRQAVRFSSGKHARKAKRKPFRSMYFSPYAPTRVSAPFKLTVTHVPSLRAPL